MKTLKECKKQYNILIAVFIVPGFFLTAYFLGYGYALIEDIIKNFLG